LYILCSLLSVDGDDTGSGAIRNDVEETAIIGVSEMMSRFAKAAGVEGGAEC
jgi:hypothetical protein